jgi:hypothetical protein
MISMTTRRSITALLLIALAGPAWGGQASRLDHHPASPEEKKSAQATNDLTLIGQALHNYHDLHGSFPPAYLVDASGQPTVSWRVVILPYLGEQALYDRFDLGKPWNDPVNLPLLKQMPHVYLGPPPGRRRIYTSYAGVAGPNQLFQGGGLGFGDGVALTDITDGTSNTISVGPVGRAARIPWTAPQDIQIEQHPTLGDPDGFDLAGQPSTPMLLIDGFVRSIPNTADPAVVLGLSTIAGGEVTPAP